jgi:anaerobic magnesium-protoporphyrin IX monomethyl ester cyclase
MTEPAILLVSGSTPLRVSELAESGVFLPPAAIPVLLQGRETICLSTATLGVISIATFLQEHGIRVAAIQDFHHDEIDTTGVDIVGISSTFMDLAYVGEIASYIKGLDSRVKIVLGGPLSWSFAPDDMWRAIPDIDVVVTREGERTFLDVIRAIRTGSPLEGIPGISLREGESSIQTAPRSPMDLDELPPPDWTLARLRDKIRVLPLETARGCVNNCAFCSEVNYWGKPVRHKSVKRVAAEVRRTAEQYGITAFRIVDSCFTAPPQRCGEICDAIYDTCTKRGADIRWTSYARVDNLTPDLLERMKRSGCVALDVGMESGDPGILRSMGKHYTPDKIVEVAEMARQVGILLHYNVVIGFPGETAASVQNTIQALERASPDTYSPFVLDVAPHTRIYENSDKYGIHGQRLQWKHRTMTSQEAAEAVGTILANVSSSTLFPGGEYLAGYLVSLGFSIDETRSFFGAIGKLWRSEADDGTMEVIGRVGKALGRFW